MESKGKKTKVTLEEVKKKRGKSKIGKLLIEQEKEKEKEKKKKH